MEKTFTIENREWSDIIGEDEVGRTISRLFIKAGDTILTENYNLFSKSVHKEVLLSAYPLATWLLRSWWRIFYEPTSIDSKPDIDWRMSHEVGAADYGFVWPKIAFVSDFQNIFIDSRPTEDRNQSVRYINALASPVAVRLDIFRSEIESFIVNTIERLNSFDGSGKDLEEFFELIKDEMSDPDLCLYRKFEAQMHFDPDEAPEILINSAIEHMKMIGESSMDELSSADREAVGKIDYFKEVDGVSGEPSSIMDGLKHELQPNKQPWCIAVEDAKRVREMIGNRKEPLDNDQLHDLLGLSAEDEKRWSEIAGKVTSKRLSIGILENNGTVNFLPRKSHPFAKRFEMARFIADYIISKPNEWMVSTDQGTARQKYQRAFSAEFLCPIEGLLEYLQEDFSISAIEDAADHFRISQKAVESLLANNGYIQREESYYSFF